MSNRNGVFEGDLCSLCPRNCKADRKNGQAGVCGVTGSEIYVARAALHMWEEPFISGKQGSGTVFFSGCSLRCVYCQNHEISRGMAGRGLSVEELSDLCIDLQKKGAHNINLVTPTHYADAIREALLLAKEKGLYIPVVYNSSGYEKPEIIEAIEDVIDIWLTDLKYMREETARSYSRAPDYPKVAKAAIETMVKVTGDIELSEDGMLRKGVVVRHLLLPGHVGEAKEVVKYLYEKYGAAVCLSLMNQYTPVSKIKEYSELNRKVTKREYDRLVSYALDLGIENGFIQEGDTAKESFIPSFNFET